MFWISSGSVVISPFSFLILLSRTLSLCPLVSLAKGSSILLIFSKNQFLVWLILCMVLFVSTWLISALSLSISCHILFLGEYASFCSRAFRCALKLLVCSLSSIFLGVLRCSLPSPSLKPACSGVELPAQSFCHAYCWNLLLCCFEPITRSPCYWIPRLFGGNWAPPPSFITECRNSKN